MGEEDEKKEEKEGRELHAAVPKSRMLLSTATGTCKQEPFPLSSGTCKPASEVHVKLFPRFAGTIVGRDRHCSSATEL